MNIYLSSIEKEILKIPMIDSHCHVTDPKIYKHSMDVKTPAYKSRFCGALIDLAGVGVFLRAGLTKKEENDIRYGAYNADQCIETLMKYMPDVEYTNHVVFCKKGAEILYGLKIPELTHESIKEIDRAAERLDLNFGQMFDKAGIKKVLLNMWISLGVSYYGKYQHEMTEQEKMIDLRCNARIATFDYHSAAPFNNKTKVLADLCGKNFESFDEYDEFLEALADYYVNKMNCVGFKFSEAYFRKLDYQPVTKDDARKCYKQSMSDEEKKKLSDYVSLKILDLARAHNVVAQFHTGLLWGTSNMEIINPLHLENTIKSMPDLKFDLLHCGYPFLAEMEVLAKTYSNVFININPMLKRSHEQTKQWFETYLNITSQNHIMFGMDTFTPETMCGGAYFTKRLVGEVMLNKVQRGLISEDQALKLAEMVLWQNSERLYQIKQ